WLQHLRRAIPVSAPQPDTDRPSDWTRMMTASFDGRDELGLSQQLEALQRENHKLRTIRDALMQRADGENDLGRAGYMLVQPVIDVETGVERRIKKLARAVSEAKIARRQLQQAVDAIAEGFILYDA